MFYDLHTLEGDGAGARPEKGEAHLKVRLLHLEFVSSNVSYLFGSAVFKIKDKYPLLLYLL